LPLLFSCLMLCNYHEDEHYVGLIRAPRIS
jgi:hypothetical protein